MNLVLDGVWDYLIDGNGHFTHDSLPKSGWGKMVIPNNWCLAGLENYSGVVWFRKRFDILLTQGEEYWLRFHGVDYFAKVWLNGVYLGDHEGYFQPFEFHITRLLRPKENELLVRVDSPREEPGTVWPDRKHLIKGVLNHHDCRPGGWDLEHGQDMNTGGIWNHVEIYTTRGIRVVRLQITPQLFTDGSAAVEVGVEFQNLGDEASVACEIELIPENFDGEGVAWVGETRLPPGKTEFCRILHLKKPGLWWTWDLGQPNLYKAVVTLRSGENVLDSHVERFGIRELVVDKEKGWKLNGIRFFPRGTNVIPALWLSEYTTEKIKQDIELLRGANVNAVRVHAHVTHPDFYHACDEAGILVWQDFPLQWSYEESEDFHNRAARQLREMIKLLYNHPSIGVWCCHNEPNANKDKLDHVLYQVARGADPSRYVEHHSGVRDHPYPGWYYGHWSMFADIPGAPFVNEFGAQALPNMESMCEILPEEKLWPPDWGAWAYHNFQYDQTFHIARIEMGGSLEEFVQNSQDYQYRLLKFAIERYRASGKMTGIFQFMFVDPWPAITWSVVDYWRRPKKGYQALKCGFQPVLVVLTYGRDRIDQESGGHLFHEISIVNDLHRDFPGAELHLVLMDPAGNSVLTESITVDVPAQGASPFRVITPMTKAGAWRIPPNAPPGQYVLRVELVHEKMMISKNEYTFEVVPRDRILAHAAL
jgi:beta-mannosidase